MDWIRHKQEGEVNHHAQISVPLLRRIKGEMVSEVHSDCQQKTATQMMHDCLKNVLIAKRANCLATSFSGTVD
jgi:hypothetical protein